MVSHSEQRDDLDRQLSRALKKIRVGRPVPDPSPEEPSDDQLLRLVDGQLPEHEQQQLERSLHRFPYSADRVAILRDALADFQRTRLSPDQEALPAGAPQPQQEPAEDRQQEQREQEQPSRGARLVFAVAEGVVQWLRGTDVPVPLAALAVATRGASLPLSQQSFYRFERKFGEWDSVIQVEAVPGRGMEVRLEIARQGVLLTDGRAELRQRGRLLESVRVREGVAGFADLKAARYELSVTDREGVVSELTLDFLPSSADVST